jgi:uncharacterized protein YqfA (UPF0365 family)
MDATQKTFLFVFLAMMAFFALVVAFAFVLVLRPWLRAFLHGAPVSIFHIVAMRLRGNPPWLLIDAYIALRRADLGVTIGDIENAFVGGRNRVLTSEDLVELVKKGAKA